MCSISPIIFLFCVYVRGLTDFYSCFSSRQSFTRFEVTFMLLARMSIITDEQANQNSLLYSIEKK